MLNFELDIIDEKCEAVAAQIAYYKKTSSKILQQERPNKNFPSRRLDTQKSVPKYKRSRSREIGTKLGRFVRNYAKNRQWGLQITNSRRNPIQKQLERNTSPSIPHLNNLYF